MPDNPDISDIVEGKAGMKFGILPCTSMVRRTLYEQIIESDPYLHQSGQFIRGDMQFVAEITTICQVHYSGVPGNLSADGRISYQKQRCKEDD